MVWWSDGGRRRSPAARRPIEGRTKVVRFVLGGLPKFTAGWDVSITEVNGAGALVARVGDTVVAVLSFEVRDGSITQVQVMVNPDKAGLRTPSARAALTFPRRKCHIRHRPRRPS